MFLIWTNPKKGITKKRVLQRDAFEGETYYEAIPTTAILTTLVLSTFFASIFQLDSDIENESPLELVIGSDVSDVPFFLATFASSVLTTTLGLSKALKTGPCKIFPGTSQPLHQKVFPPRLCQSHQSAWEIVYYTILRCGLHRVPPKGWCESS